MSSEAPRRRDPSQYRPDLRPMLILVGLLVAIVAGWALLGPRILPPAASPDASATGLDGRWTRTPEDPRATTLAIDGAGYTVEGTPGFTGDGTVGRDGDQLVVTDDPACPGATGRYSIMLGDADRAGLLPEHRAQTLTLSPVSDDCAAREEALSGVTWMLRLSDRDGVYGICDPPNEEAAVTGHWPEPSGCG